MIFTVMGRKGGITKTTLAVNLAAGCARAGLRTVVVDADGQGSASTSVAVEPHDAFYQVVLEDAEFRDVLVKAPVSFAGDVELYLLSAFNAQRLVEQHTSTSRSIYERFREELADWADVVIVDTSPGITEVHTGFYFASDFILLPTLCEFSSITSLFSTLDYLASAERAGKAAGYQVAEILGVIPNRFDAREKVQQENQGFIKGQFYNRLKVFPLMRNLAVWNQCSQMRESIFTYHPEDDPNARRQARTAVNELKPVLEAIVNKVKPEAIAV